MKQLARVAAGSAIGGTARYLIDIGLAERLPYAVPTLIANVSGSLLIGWLAGRWAMGGAAAPHPYKWHFWMTGVCGGYTTFSAFSWQVLTLLESGDAQGAGLYAAGSVGLGLLATWIGLSMAVRSKGGELENG